MECWRRTVHASARGDLELVCVWRVLLCRHFGVSVMSHVFAPYCVTCSRSQGDEMEKRAFYIGSAPRLLLFHTRLPAFLTYLYYLLILVTVLSPFHSFVSADLASRQHVSGWWFCLQLFLKVRSSKVSSAPTSTPLLFFFSFLHPPPPLPKG